MLISLDLESKPKTQKMLEELRNEEYEVIYIFKSESGEGNEERDDKPPK